MKGSTKQKCTVMLHSALDLTDLATLDCQVKVVLDFISGLYICISPTNSQISEPTLNSEIEILYSVPRAL